MNACPLNQGRAIRLSNMSATMLHPFDTEINYRELAMTPAEGVEPRYDPINHSSFKGSKAKFRNIHGREVEVVKYEDGKIYDVRERGSAKEIVFGGVYEVPDNHKWRKDCRFIMMHKQNEHNPGSWPYQLNEYVCVQFIGQGDQDIASEINGDELAAIAAWSVEKHGKPLNVLWSKKTGGYIIKDGCGHGAVLENSGEIEDGLYSCDREIPAMKDLEFQSSLDRRTQIAPGVYADADEGNDRERYEKYYAGTR